MTYFIELDGKWPKSRTRLLQIIGWSVAQIDPTYAPPREVWYQGGGVRLPEDAYTERGAVFTGMLPKFVMNGIYAAIIPRREDAEELALRLAVKEPVLMGKLYLSGVTRLGVVTKEAKLCEKPKRS